MNAIFNNKTLENFINLLRVEDDDRKFLLSKVPTLDLEERKVFLRALANLYAVDLEEDKSLGVINKISNLWQKQLA